METDLNEVVLEKSYRDLKIRIVRKAGLFNFVYLIQEYDHDHWNVLDWHTKNKFDNRETAMFDVGYRIGVLVGSS